jgi:hypothetical protein
MRSITQLQAEEKKAEDKYRAAQRKRQAAEKKDKAGQKQQAKGSAQPFPSVLQHNWSGSQHLSGRANTQRIEVGGARRYLAFVDGKALSGTYAKRRHARAACSQKLRRLGLKVGVDWTPTFSTYVPRTAA